MICIYTIYSKYSDTLYSSHTSNGLLASPFPANILLKSISDRYRPDRYPVGPITVRYRFKQNASWVIVE